MKKKKRKNNSDNDHTLSLNFDRIFSQHILGAGPEGFKWMKNKFDSHKNRIIWVFVHPGKLCNRCFNRK